MTSPPLPYVAVAESFKLPPGMNFRGTSGIAFNSQGDGHVAQDDAETY
jgi:hypothetical protein